MKRRTTAAIVTALLAMVAVLVTIALLVVTPSAIESPPETTPPARHEPARRPRVSRPPRPESLDVPAVVEVDAADDSAEFEYPGRVEGTVTDRLTGAGVEGAGVVLFLPSGELVERTSTDPRGDYTFPHVPVGIPLVLRLSAKGYSTGFACALAAVADRTSRKDAALVPGAFVRVHVTSVRWLEDVRYAEVELDGPEGVLRGETDAVGAVEFRAPVRGEYRLRIRCAGFATRPPETIRLPMDAPDVALERTLSEGGGLAVTVVGADGRSVAGAQVRAVNEGETSETVETDAEGRALLRNLDPTGVWTVIAATPSGSVAWAFAQVKDGLVEDVRARLLPSGTLEGTVTDALRRPVKGARVRFAPLGRDAVAPQPIATDAEGRFRIDSVPIGTYAVTAAHAPGSAASEEARVRIGQGSTHEVRLVLPAEPRVPVRGFVVTPTGDPVSGVQVLTHDGDGAMATTRHDGGFTLGSFEPETPVRLASATEGLDFVALDGRGAVFGVASGDVVQTVTVLAIRTDAPPVATVRTRRSTPATGRPTVEVLGSVRDERERPLPGARVSYRGRTTMTASDGSFRLSRVRAPDEAVVDDLIVFPAWRMHQPAAIRVELAPDDARIELPPVYVSLRPYLLLTHVAAAEESGRPLLLLCSLPDEFLGARRAPGTRIEAVTYDGAWIHLPPAVPPYGDDAVVVATAPAEVGDLTASHFWRPMRDRADVFQVGRGTGNTVSLDTRLPVAYESSPVELVQTRVTIDVRALRALKEATGTDDAESLLHRDTTFSVSGAGTRRRIERVAGGTYRARVVARTDPPGPLEAEVDTRYSTRLKFDRRAETPAKSKKEKQEH